ncbi:hypothetical protein SMG44B_10510 [Stenotrophomonas maltophilia]
MAVATSMGMFGRDLHEFLTEDVKGLITHVVTGKDQKPEEQIDKSLAWMQVALSSVDGIKILNDPGLQEDKTRAMWFIGLGTGGLARCCCSMRSRWRCSSVSAHCSSSVCCSIRPNNCSSDGSSTESGPCSRWRCCRQWCPLHWIW